MPEHALSRLGDLSYWKSPNKDLLVLFHWFDNVIASVSVNLLVCFSCCDLTEGAVPWMTSCPLSWQKKKENKGVKDELDSFLKKTRLSFLKKVLPGKHSLLSHWPELQLILEKREF